MADGVAEAYLANLNGSINLSRNYKRMLVDSGNAFIKDFGLMSFQGQVRHS